ncbi:LysR family transcriptional regulator [Novosphingobium sp. 9]|uniref:LysR family transcriptional regulator n=1 Tax=Novosphingobium sp. 9 TaxID=2025349 RepID=UPI0021B676E5|nr:LysR family transcriptional regulator [Novosphingobium sp. 9]
MELRDFDLNLLLVMDALFEEGTLTRAAQRLRLSQPTISAALAKLRSQLGDELFIRASGSMQPTARAQALRPAITGILQSVRSDVLAQADFAPSTYHGTITLSLSDIGELEFLPRLLALLEAEAPGARLRSVVANPQDLAAMMDAGEVDLAIGYFPDLVTAVFKQQLLFRHGSACIVRNDHPTIRKTLTLEDYLAARHIAVAPAGRLRDVVEATLAAQHLHREVALEIPHFINLPFLVEASDLVATVPQPLAQQFARICALRVFEVPFAVPALEIKQLWHKRYDGHPRLQWLRRIVARVIQNRPHLGVA